MNRGSDQQNRDSGNAVALSLISWNRSRAAGGASFRLLYLGHDLRIAPHVIGKHNDLKIGVVVLYLG